MKLKALQISSFKSFADKTTINFEDGITGIVGPNGSGKSNIIEAIRWVMGEQSAKSLRGGKMPDVIFAGSQNRKPLNRAAVTITFDNSDHFLKTDFTEVSVTRKLFRNGDSQYLINQNECRLKDVLNLFIDTGLGRDSFSVISQGRVESIFNSKPEDRRTIIEEVAGVLAYKQDKQKAEQELTKTNDNLDRVSDLIAELHSQIEPLEEQSSLAQDYLDQKKQFDQLDKTRLVNLIDKLQTQSNTTQADIDEANRLVTQYSSQKKELNAAVTNLKDQRQVSEKEKDQLQADLLETTKKYENLAGQQNVDSEKNKYQQQQVAELGQSVKKNEQELEKNQDQKQQLEKKVSDYQKTVGNLKKQLAKLSEKEMQQRQQDAQEKIDQLQASYIEKMQQLAQVHNEQANLKKSYEQDSQQQLHVNADLVKLQTQLQDLKQSYADQQKKVAQLEKQTTVAEDQLKLALTDYQKFTNQQKQGQDSWLQAIQVYQQAKTRLETLSSSETELRGFYQGVQSVLKNRNQFKGLVGVVSDLLKVPEKYTKAVETVLGSQLQQLVTKKDQDARNIIQYLTQHRAGRVTLLPLTTIRAKQISPKVRQELENSEGFEGVASDLVETDQSLIVVKQYLLGNILIASDLDHASKISKQLTARLRFVTLNGEIINPSGSMTGGVNRHQTAGLLTQKQQRNDLSKQVSQMKSELENREELVQDLKQKMTAAETKGSELRQQFNTANDQYKDAQRQLEMIANQVKELNRRIDAVSYEFNQKGDYKNTFESQSTNLADQEKSLNDELTVITTKTDTQKADLTQLRQTQNANQQSITQLREQLATVQAQLTQGKTILSERDQKIKSLQQLVLDAKNRQLDLQKQQRVQGSKSQTTQEELASDQQHIENLKKELSKQQASFETLEQTLAQKETGLQRVQELNSVASDDLQDIKVKQTRVSEQVDHALNDLSEKYQLSFELAKKDRLDIDQQDLERQLKLIKKGLDEIGDVNVGAIDEYQRVSTRHQFLTEQKDDLMTSQKQLLETINEIDTEAATRFKTTFDQVSASFSKVFVRMFGGGKAKLELTDPEHLLTTGLEIKAQPPGKKFQRLSLLSGGERALTAITLLFSILEVKPVPFCILDEVEAAFDDANVSRFADYLRNFQQQTQFVVITHRKGTMVECDVLYGVTMQESGVSKMASVSLEDLS
ncbi:chromosome segregation protein SMC [Pediococcus damnosus]|uniref:Chromosome partition protein Smc n=1 Tax=Pediococcus damnosus TaxID=51663 RepID=A0AAC9B0W5_9LACO|nr:chromosome segregation protein SMC [Pediococcus damnosus]AMV62199.1 Chromosome partition protein smc [Pediococcus damnosus]KRN52515.1 cell division protein Smc [Pediococcus damnosus]PJE48656.1 chromosome segregation protein SMC [Pediococcus damnosus]